MHISPDMCCKSQRHSGRRKYPGCSRCCKAWRRHLRAARHVPQIRDGLKNNITIAGPRTAIIDASHSANGIHVGAPHFSPGRNPVCPAKAVRNFALNGLTIQNADRNGIFLSGVDGYAVTGGKFVNNGDYAVYPSCSDIGQILNTYARILASMWAMSLWPASQEITPQAARLAFRP